jgi:hypothetical protein
MPNGRWGRPNGGYLLAMRGRCAVEVGDQPDVVAASAVDTFGC